MGKTLIIVLTNVAQVFLVLTGLFYFFLSLRGFFPGSRPPAGSRKNRFALLLPAYNEEKVIRFAVESLKNIDYPAELFDIFVVTDHCTDATGDIARSLGARVLDHSAPGMKPGKGRALKWAVSEILKLDRYDFFCYFDADSLAHPGFLNAMNGHVNLGEEAVQGRQLAKNTEVWLAKILAAGHIISNRFFQMPKYMCGLSATLHGKGMCFSKRVTALFPWHETCLTEDIEMQMRLIKNGIRITWAQDAVVFDEEPVTLRQYVKRNIRWTRGSFDTAKLHLKGLCARMFRDIKALEGALYCGGVYKLCIAVFIGGLMYLTRNSFVFLFWLYQQLPDGAAAKAAILLPLFFYPVAALVIEKAAPEMFVAYLLQPALGILRLPVYMAGLVRGNAYWGRTDHSSQVAITDLVGE